MSDSNDSDYWDPYVRSDDYDDYDDYEDDDDSINWDASMYDTENSSIDCPVKAVGINKNHKRELLEFLKESWEKEEFCDLTIIINKKPFKTHRVALAVISDYFKAMLLRNEENEIILDIPSVNGTVFEEILKYAYTGMIDFTKIEDQDQDQEVIQNIGEAADFLGIVQLKEFCDGYLSQEMTLDNCLPMYVYSEIYNMPELYKKSSEMFMKNFFDLSNRSEFLEIPVTVLSKFLSNDKLYVYDRKLLVPPNHSERELIIFEAVIKYISYNMKNCNDVLDTKSIVDLLKSVKMLSFKIDFLKCEITKDSTLQGNQYVQDLISCVEKYMQNKEEIPDDFQFWRSEREMRGTYFMGKRLANGNEVGRDEIEWFCDFDENELSTVDLLTNIVLWIRRWDDRPVLGAIQFTNDKNVRTFAGEPDTDSMEKHEVQLKKGEVIVSVEASSGWMIDSLKFKTNLDREFGPFGGDGGGRKNCKPVKLRNGVPYYLHSFKGASVRTQGTLGIVHLLCRWVTFDL